MKNYLQNYLKFEDYLQKLPQDLQPIVLKYFNTDGSSKDIFSEDKIIIDILNKNNNFTAFYLDMNLIFPANSFNEQQIKSYYDIFNAGLNYQNYIHNSYDIKKDTLFNSSVSNKPKI